MQKLYCFLILLLSCTSYDYDYLLFVIENAGTVCQMKDCSNDYQGKELGGIFNMHGLWPNYFNGSWPASCGNLSKIRYQDSLISSSVLDELNDNWVGLYSNTFISYFKQFFVEHHSETMNGKSFQIQYNQTNIRHGSCYEEAKSDSSNSFNSQMNDYFSTTMDIKKTLDLESIIFDSSKMASDGQTYWDYDELKQTLEQATGVSKFAFNCRSGSTQKLYTLEFCLSKQLQFIDCPDALSFHYNCTKGSIAVPTLNAH